MKFNLFKAIKSTHRHPVNILLHCIGLPLYFHGLYIIVEYFMNQNIQVLHGIILWLCAISLFILGHKIEGNLKAITLVVIYKHLRFYFKTKINIKKTNCSLLNNSN